MERCGMGMKIFFSLLALVLFACVTRAANPSFSAFDPNFFQVTGTGGGSIKIKTNAFTWLNAGGSTSPFTNSLGTVSNLVGMTQFVATAQAPDGTTPYTQDTSVLHTSGFLSEQKNAGLPVWQVGVNGGILQGSNTAGIYGGAPNAGEVLISISDVLNGDVDYKEFTMQTQRGATNALVTATVETELVQLNVTRFQGGGIMDRITLNSQLGTPYFEIASGSGAPTVVKLAPGVGDGTTPHLLSTTIPHTSGNLLEVKNAGLLPWSAAFHGGMQVGSNTLAYFGANDPGEVFVSYSDISKGDPNKNYQIFGVTDGSIESNYEMSITTNRALITVASTGTAGFDSLSFNSQPGANKMLITVNNTDRTQWFPAAGATTLPHFTDTSVLHTSNGLFENRNLGLVHFRTETTNGVSTPRIAALSATSRPWQFGSVVSNATITASVTNYVELAVNGSLYKLVIANP